MPDQMQVDRTEKAAVTADSLLTTSQVRPE